MDDKLLLIHQEIEERYARMVWTYEIQFEQSVSHYNWWSWLTTISIITSAITSIAAVVSAILKVFNISESIVTYIVAVVSVITSTIIAIIKDKDFKGRSDKCNEYGVYIRQIAFKYEAFLVDIKAGRYSYDEACSIRDNLLTEETELLKTAPLTFNEALKKADEKIKKNHVAKITEKEKQLMIGKHARL